MSSQLEVIEKEFERDLRDFKSNLKLEQIPRNTTIVVVAVAKNHRLNSSHVISSRNGTPINNIVHNFVDDCFHINCYDNFILGEVPVSYYLSVKNIFGWKVLSPLPGPVVKRHLSAVQKKRLKDWSNSLKLTKKEYEITYLQIVDCHKNE